MCQTSTAKTRPSLYKVKSTTNTKATALEQKLATIICKQISMSSATTSSVDSRHIAKHTQPEQNIVSAS